MPLALLSALAGWVAALAFTSLVVVVVAAFFANWLIRLYAGEAALPALFKLLREGTLNGTRLPRRSKGSLDSSS